MVDKSAGKPITDLSSVALAKEDHRSPPLRYRYEIPCLTDRRIGRKTETGSGPVGAPQMVDTAKGQ